MGPSITVPAPFISPSTIARRLTAWLIAFLTRMSLNGFLVILRTKRMDRSVVVLRMRSEETFCRAAASAGGTLRATWASLVLRAATRAAPSGTSLMTTRSTFAGVPQ